MYGALIGLARARQRKRKGVQRTEVVAALLRQRLPEPFWFWSAQEEADPCDWWGPTTAYRPSKAAWLELSVMSFVTVYI